MGGRLVGSNVVSGQEAKRASRGGVSAGDSLSRIRSTLAADTCQRSPLSVTPLRMKLRVNSEAECYGISNVSASEQKKDDDFLRPEARFGAAIGRHGPLDEIDKDPLLQMRSSRRYTPGPGRATGRLRIGTSYGNMPICECRQRNRRKVHGDGRISSRPSPFRSSVPPTSAQDGGPASNNPKL